MGSTGHSRRDFFRVSGVALAGFAVTTTGCDFDDDDDNGPVALPSPTDRQGEFVEVNGANIFYQSVGSGEPMVLLHGYPLSGALFVRVRDDLARRYRVITLDHRGYGMSMAPGVPDTIAVYAQDALDVMTAIGVEQAIIGGMSMGGPIVFEMYQRAPARFRGMMLIDTIAAPAPPAEAGLWRGVAEMIRQEGVDSLPAFLIKDMLSGDTRVNQPELVNFLSAVINQASMDAAIGGTEALSTRPDFRPLLPQIQVPTLVYVGVEDTIYPVTIAQMMAEAIPNSTLVTIPGAAHAAIFEAPERSVRAILNWAAGI